MLTQSREDLKNTIYDLNDELQTLEEDDTGNFKLLLIIKEKILSELKCK